MGNKVVDLKKFQKLNISDIPKQNLEEFENVDENHLLQNPTESKIEEREIFDVFVDYKHFAEYFFYHILHFNLLGPLTFIVLIVFKNGYKKALNLGFIKCGLNFVLQTLIWLGGGFIVVMKLSGVI